MPASRSVNRESRTELLLMESPAYGISSERVPGRARGVFQIADVGAKPQSDAGADRHQDNIVCGQRGHAEAADDVGGTVDAGEALVNRVSGGEIVHQRHGARSIATPIEA